MILSAINDEICNDFTNQINILKKNNISHIELRKINNKNLWELNDEELLLISNMLAKENIKVSVIDSPIGKHGIPNIDNYIKLAKLTSCKYIRIFYNNNLSKLNKIAEKNKITFLIENERNIEPENLLEINSNVKKYRNIKLLLDLENLYTCGYNISDILSKTIQNIRCIHVRNIKKNKYVGLINGEIDYHSIFNYLKFNNYNGFVSAEFHFPLNNDAANNEKKFIDSIMELINILKEREL